MALCRQPVYNLTCHQYPIDMNFTCQRYLGGKYIYTSSRNVRKTTLSRTFDKKITNFLDFLNLHLQGDSFCSRYLKLLICHFFIPYVYRIMDQVYGAKNRKSVVLHVIFFEMIRVLVKLTYWQDQLKLILFILMKNFIMVSNPY